MTCRIVIKTLATTTVAAVLAGGIVSTETASATPPADSPGTVISASPLPEALWPPGTGSAQKITYWSVGPDGAPALSTGAYFVPPGTPPEGGWPVLGWAHGTSGVGDECAPSAIGPAEPERDRSYLGRWLAHGYAVTASDYVGLGTPGVHAYLDTSVEAHSVVDMVKASRAVVPALSDRWVVIGQSQGGGAAVATARHATALGGPQLRYLGGVATGVPAGIENVFALSGPNLPPAHLPPHTTAYILWFLAGLRAARPDIRVNDYLTTYGRSNVAAAEQVCGLTGIDQLANVVIADLFSRPLADIPDLHSVLADYMGLETTGYDRPLFIGQGLLDTDVPALGAIEFAEQLRRNGQPITFRTYMTDHSGALLQSLDDSRPFVAGLFNQR